MVVTFCKTKNFLVTFVFINCEGIMDSLADSDSQKENVSHINEIHLGR